MGLSVSGLGRSGDEGTEMDEDAGLLVLHHLIGIKNKKFQKIQYFPSTLFTSSYGFG